MSDLSQDPPLLIIVMVRRIALLPYIISHATQGVSGSGKSTLGAALAASLSLPFIDGDDLHPPENVAKMSAGHPLTDADRAPWLARIRATAEAHAVSHCADDTHTARSGLVVGCSALKNSYRAVLRGERHARGAETEEDLGAAPPPLLPTYFVYIRGERESLLQRMSARKGHFMKAEMLDSQLATLEDPSDEDGVVVVPLEADTHTQVRVAREGLKHLAGNL
jgi:gluconokinase